MRPATTRSKPSSGILARNKAISKTNSSVVRSGNEDTADKSTTNRSRGKAVRVPVPSPSFVLRRSCRVKIEDARQEPTTDGAPIDRGRTRDPSTPSSIPDSVNEPGKFNQHLKKNGFYKMVVEMCRSSWGKKYKKRAKDNPDKKVIDYKVDIEVAMRKNEGHAKWDRDYARSGKHTGFTIDWIVGTAKRKLGENMAKRCLIKFTGYPLSSWENAKSIDSTRSNVSDMCRRRCLDLDTIEIRIRTEKGDAEFERLYPNRYLQDEMGLGAGGYIEDKRSRYINDLRALESRWNFNCECAGEAGIYVEDWTDLKPDFENLKKLEFICYLENSPFVEKFVKKFNQLEDMKCDNQCSTCMSRVRKGGCSKAASHCCGMEVSVDVDQNTGDFKWCDKGKPLRRLDHCMHFECTDECNCGDSCKNRHVQNGRQMTLCIFREPGKGWGVRTMSDIEKCKFVTEYTGVVNQKGMVGDLSIYDFEMAYPVKDSDGTELHKKFVVSAGEKGNESRFFNHSCNPNMNTMTSILERYGIFYNHIAFFTDRNVLAGDEMTFNYFGDNKLSDFQIRKMFPHGCRCAYRDCNWPKPWKAVKEETEEEEEEDALAVALMRSPSAPSNGNASESGSDKKKGLKGLKEVKEELNSDDEEEERNGRKKNMNEEKEKEKKRKSRREEEEDESHMPLVPTSSTRSQRGRNQGGSDKKKENGTKELNSADEEEERGRRKKKMKEEGETEKKRRKREDEEERRMEKEREKKRKSGREEEYDEPQMMADDLDGPSVRGETEKDQSDDEMPRILASSGRKRSQGGSNRKKEKGMKGLKEMKEELNSDDEEEKRNGRKKKMEKKSRREEEEDDSHMPLMPTSSTRSERRRNQGGSDKKKEKELNSDDEEEERDRRKKKLEEEKRSRKREEEEERRMEKESAKKRKIRREEEYDPQMMADDLDGPSMREENEKTQSDEMTRILTASGRKRSQGGSNRKKEKGMKELKEVKEELLSDDGEEERNERKKKMKEEKEKEMRRRVREEEEEGRRMEKERGKKRKMRREDEEEKNKKRRKMSSSESNSEDDWKKKLMNREQSPQYARRAVGRDMKALVKKNGRVVTKEEEDEDLKHQMERGELATSSSSHPSSDSGSGDSTHSSHSSSSHSMSSEDPLAPSSSSTYTTEGAEGGGEKRRNGERKTMEDSRSPPSHRRSLSYEGEEGPSTSQGTRGGRRSRQMDVDRSDSESPPAVRREQRASAKSVTR